MHLFNISRIAASLSLCFVVGAFAQQAPATGKITAVPRLIRFTGAVPATNNPAPAGVVGARFAIYGQQDGGTALWSELQNVTVDSSGNYVAVLGSTTNEGIPAELFLSNESRWLEVEFQAPGAVPQPRVLLASVPYAMKAADAETLGGRPASDYLLAGTATTPLSGSDKTQTTSTGVAVMAVGGGAQPRVDSGMAGYIAMFSSPTDVVDSVLFQSGGFVGFGTTSPNHGLHVFNNSPIFDSNLNGQLYVQNTYPNNSQGHASLVLDKGSSSASAALSFNSVGVQVWDVGATDDNNFHIRSLGSSNTKPQTIEQHAPQNSLYINSTGNVGLGTATPAAKLEVNGNAQVDGALTVSGNILGPGMVGAIIMAPNNGTSSFSAGIGSLPASATGANNTAVGDGSLAAATSGFSNSAIGTNALSHNTTGSSNVAIGASALGANISGQTNVAIGNQALSSNVSGSSNLAFGNQALSGATGSGNIGIGGSAGIQITNGNSNIEIGNIGTINDSGVIRLGNNGAQTATFIAGIQGVTTGSNNTMPVVIDINGQLGTVSSSRRFKEDIQDMGDASSGLMQLRPVTFRYIRAYDDGTKPIQYGLIAEEVADVYPDLVVSSADGQIQTVKYQVLDSMLLNEVQKQRATIANQAREIQSLQDRLARLEARLDNQHQQVANSR